MKTTGIVRRIDDLGRIVIPKEMRRTLGIQEGDPMEVFMANGGIVVKRYYPSDQWIEQLADLGNKISRDTDIDLDTRMIIVQKINDLMDTFKHKKSPSSAVTE